MSINWYPGHMAKTRRKITESLKMVDAIIEIRDARIVESSANPDIDKLCGNKPRIILLNKFDLADERVTQMWQSKLSKGNTKVILTNCTKGTGLREIKPALEELLKEKHDRLRKKGMQNIVIRAMVVGIPNVGKSTFINTMSRSKRAKTGDRPGVTRSNQWIKTEIGIELLDTPGILWPKLGDEHVGLHLAFTGAIKDEIMNIEDLAFKLVENLEVNYPDMLKARYKIDDIQEMTIENMDAIARKRGHILRGNEIDYNRVSVMLLDEFRGGQIGKISLEKPQR